MLFFFSSLFNMKQFAAYVNFAWEYRYASCFSHASALKCSNFSSTVPAAVGSFVHFQMLNFVTYDTLNVCCTSM